MEEIDKLVARLRKASGAEVAEIRDHLLALATGPRGSQVRDHLDDIRKGELLEVQWEIEEVLDVATPKKPVAREPAVEEPPPPPADPNAPLTAADLNLVYDDPRGLMLYKSKVGERWFATQVDPQSGQPQTFELRAEEVAQLKGQLQGSPYWVLGG